MIAPSNPAAGDCARYIQGTAVEIDGAGVLILGPSGVGKSSLALQLIDRGALLIGDDRVWFDPSTLLLSCHPRIAGLVEIREFGPVSVRAAGPTCLRLTVKLDAQPHLARPDQQVGSFETPIQFYGHDPALPVKVLACARNVLAAAKKELAA